MKVACIMTCFNRAALTISAIKSLEKNKNIIDYYVVDDNSTDGTEESLINLNNSRINIIHGTGQLFYGGGMRLGMECVIDNKKDYDYVLLINNDVQFYENAIDKLIDCSKKLPNCVVVGCTENDQGKLSYGGIKYKSKFSTKYYKVGVDNREECDTFNGNCVLIPFYIFNNCGVYDKVFIHNFAEFDYGHTIVRHKYKIFSSDFYVGVCNNNSLDGTWYDKKYSKIKRLKLKESCKGAPLRVVWHYYFKNFNIVMAIRCAISGYIRILIK